MLQAHDATLSENSIDMTQGMLEAAHSGGGENRDALAFEKPRSSEILARRNQ